MRHIGFILLTFFSIGLLISGCQNPSQQSTSDEEKEVTLEDLNQKIEKFGGSGDDYFQRAQLNFQEGNLQVAADDVVQAMNRDSTKVEYLHLLSDIQLNGFQSRQALQTLEYAANRNPQNRLTLLKLMETQILLRQYMPALGTSQRLLQIDPQDHETFFLRGLLFKEQRADSLAIVNFQRVVDLDPTMTSAFVILGDLHEKKSDPIAEGYYRNAVLSDPDNVSALHALAFYLQNYDKADEALTTYQQIIELDTTFQPAFVNQGILLLRDQQLEAAKSSLEKGLKIDSSFVINLYYLGVTEIKLGNTKGGKALLQKALDIDPEYTAAQEALEEL